ncbi:MAG TPA: rhomboid family intramembrane serine protease, partial [Nocardioides sp.]|nr:rhomboid family intramembrane serine protease [Nocardioides sp.]
YLIVRGFLNRRTSEILIGVAVFLLYSGALLGVLPGQPGVSWQGHLFGAIGGFLAARLLTTRQRNESSITY